MAINIPSNLPLPPLQDFHQQELIRPTEAPSIIEGVNAVDPRIALNVAMPVVPSGNGSNLSDSVSSGLQNSAVILEIANAEIANLKDGGQTLAQSIAKLDSLGSIALGELLSELFASDQSSPSKSTVAVNWPSMQSDQSGASMGGDLKSAMSTLYRNLENSGFFAANQLKSLMMPASKSDEDQHAFHQTLSNDANSLLAQLNTDNPLVRDSVKLLLKGDLVWQGQLLPDVKANIYRQDAWEGVPHNPSEVVKGTRFTLSVTLPNLGPFDLVGTQFGEQVSIAIHTSNNSKEILLEHFKDLMLQISQKNRDSVNISFAKDGGD